MVEIPEPLQNEEFRFIKVKTDSKRPFENNWQNDANYTYNDPEIQKHLEQGGNYGVVGGYGNLVIIDCDQDHVEHAVAANLPDTLKIRSGGGGAHYYYICPDLNDPIRLQDTDAGDLGDVQSKGKQVVGPTSNHPSGGTYRIEEEHEIAEVEAEEIRFALRKFMMTDTVNPETEQDAIDQEYDEQDDDIELNIVEVVNVAQLERRGDEYYGSHPIHGSSTGHNFWVNTTKNTWHCFRHDTGGGPLSWIAVKEGIINCGDAQPGQLRGNDFKQAIEAGREKYGLPDPVKKFESGEITGWNGIIQLFEDSNTSTAETVSTIADHLLETYNFKTPRDSRRLWRFGNPVYESDGEQFVREQVYQHLKGYIKSHHVNDLLDEVKARSYCDRRSEEAPHKYIPVENGWYNVETGELEDAKPEYFAINHIPIEYDADADCPKIKEFIGEIVREEDVKLIQEMIGFCLYRDYKFERAFMMLGSGGNGKSTLLKLVEHFLGEENISNPSLQKLGSSEYASAELYGKLANLHGDLSTKAVEDTGTFKMLTGDDLINARRIYENPFKFRNYATLIFSANDLPKTYDTSEAFFRRWIVIDFPYKFTSDPDDGNKDKDPSLPDSLFTEEELSGLFNWAVEGLKRILEQDGFSKTAGRESVKYRWLMETQPIQVYFEEGLVERQDVSTPKDELYKHYEDFCQTVGVQKKGRTQFFKQLYGAYPSVHEKRVRTETSREQRLQGVELKKLERVVELVKGIQHPSRVRAREDTESDISKEPAEHRDQFDHPSSSEGDQLSIRQQIVVLVDENDEGEGVWKSDLLSLVDGDEDEIEDSLEKMISNGDLMEPKPGLVKLL